MTTIPRFRSTRRDPRELLSIIEGIRARRLAEGAEQRQIGLQEPVLAPTQTIPEIPVGVPVQEQEDQGPTGLKGILSRLTTPLVSEGAVRALLPKPLEPIGNLARQITSPLDIALTVGTAGLGPGIAAGLKAGGPVARLAAGALEPLVAGGLGRRVAAETGVALAGVAGSRIGEEVAGTPGAIAGGFVGAGGGVAALSRLPRTAIPARTAALRPIGERGPLRHMVRPTPRDEILANADASNVWAKEIANKDGRFPRAMTWTVERGGGISATLQSDDIASRAVLVHRRQEDQARSLINRNLAPFRAAGALFDIDDAGNVANIGGTGSKQLSQLFEDAFNPRFNFTFTPEQELFIRNAQDLVADGANFMRETGIEVGETFLEGSGSRFFPRMVNEINGIQKEVLAQNRGRSLGAKPSALKKRSYFGQEIEKGIANGVRYESDPIAILEAYQASVYRAVRDREFANLIKPLSVEAGAQIVGRAGLPVPIFKDKFFDEPTARLIQKQLGLDEKSQFQRLAETSGKIGDISRTFRTGIDFGAPLLQGLPLLATNPTKWARGVKHQFIAFAQPEFHQRYLSENIQTVDEMLRLEIPLSGAASDYYEALRKGAPLERGISKIPIAGEQVGRAVAGFQRSFDSLGDFSRIEQFKALRDTAALKGQEGLDGLATYLRNSTGALSSGRLGINPSQQAFERGFMFFSPRYTRSSLALISNAFDGGIEGELARKAFRNMAMGGIGAYLLAATALGQEPNLDPSKGDFMTVRIGNDNIGVGSFWTSFVRLIGSTADVATTDPRSLTSLSSRDNPLVRWVRGRSSPVTSVAWDTATGSDFLGTPVEGNLFTLDGLGDIAERTTEQIAPFWLEAMTLQRPATSGPVAGVSEFFGGRTFPLSLSARRNDVREQRAQAHFSKSWDDLNRLQKERIENDPAETDLRRLTEQARADRVLRGEQIDQEVDKFFGAFTRVDERWKGVVDAGYLDVQREQAVPGSTGQDLPSLRNDILDNANNIRRAGVQGIQSDPDFDNVREWLSELPKIPGRSPEKPEDFAYNEYVRTVVADPTLQLTSGFDFDERDRRIEQFRLVWGDDVFAYVNERFAEGRDTPQIIQEFWDGRDNFAFYWEGAKDEVIASRPDSSEVGRLYELWEDATEIRQQELQDEFPNLNATLKTISRVRGKLRERNAGLDAFLFRWGYTGSFRNEANQFEGSDLIARDYRPRTNYILQEGQLEEAA